MNAQLGAVLLMEVTAYGLGCDAPGPRTKNGSVPRAHWTAAADPAVLPLGAVVHVAGMGPRSVEDVGGGISGLELDVFMDDCDEARTFGRQKRYVSLLYLPEEPSRVATKPAPDRGAEARTGWQRSESGEVGPHQPGAVVRAPIIEARTPETTPLSNGSSALGHDPAVAGSVTTRHLTLDQRRLVALLGALLLLSLILGSAAVLFALAGADPALGRVVAGWLPRRLRKAAA